jgi:hypothetical protein
MTMKIVMIVAMITEYPIMKSMKLAPMNEHSPELAEMIPVFAEVVKNTRNVAYKMILIK